MVGHAHGYLYVVCISGNTTRSLGLKQLTGNMVLWYCQPLMQQLGLLILVMKRQWDFVLTSTFNAIAQEQYGCAQMHNRHRVKSVLLLTSGNVFSKDVH